MSKIDPRATASNTDSKFVFCSSNPEHFDWLNHALGEWHIARHELAPADILAVQLTQCRPQLILLDFSGNCSIHGENCTDDMIVLAHELKTRMPALHLVAVGTMAYPDGAVAALRAGVHHFIDMHANENEARDMIRTLIVAPAASPASDPCTLIALIGARAGVGTTTLSVHLADILQQRRTVQQTVHRIGLLDLGLPAGDGQLYLNIAGSFNLIDAIHNRHRLDQTLIQTALVHSRSGIKVISLPRAMSEIAGITAADVTTLLAQLRPYFDVLIVDLGGFPDIDFTAGIAKASDQAWLITDQSVGSLVSLSTMLKEFDRHGVGTHQRHVIVNRYDVRHGMVATQIADRFKLPLKIVIPECTVRLTATANLGKLLHEVYRGDPYARAIQALADSLLASNVDRRRRRSGMARWIQRHLPVRLLHASQK